MRKSRSLRQAVGSPWALAAHLHLKRHEWPPLTVKTGSLFLLFVAAVLFLVYLMVAALFHARTLIARRRVAASSLFAVKKERIDGAFARISNLHSDARREI